MLDVLLNISLISRVCFVLRKRKWTLLQKILVSECLLKLALWFISYFIFVLLFSSSGRPRYVHRHSSDESDIDSGDSDFGENELIEMVADRAALTTCRVLHVGALKRMDEAAIVNMKRLRHVDQSFGI